jgi:serine protease Do
MGEETKSKYIDRKRPQFEKTKVAGAAFLALLAVSAGFVGGWVGSQTFQNNNGINPLYADSSRVISGESQLISDIAENAGKSVVSINVKGTSATDSLFDYYYGGRETSGAGTGVIVSEDGYILTNRHVVPAGTTTVSIVLSDGTELSDVTVIGRTGSSDPLDVAFLKINDLEGNKLVPAKLADSSLVKVGDKAIAIGNALGQFQNSVTAGIISGYGRTVEAGDYYSSDILQNLFQTDAAINQGNSGGPLMNINGEVIGINTAIAGGEAQNIGFAIPINDIKVLIKGVLEKGKLERPFLGVRYISVTDDFAEEYDLPVKRGAYILPSTSGESSIIADSPAEKAGLQEEDIITKVANDDVNEKNSLVSLIGRHAVGEEVELTIYRDGTEQKLVVTIEASTLD